MTRRLPCRASISDRTLLANRFGSLRLGREAEMHRRPKSTLALDRQPARKSPKIGAEASYDEITKHMLAALEIVSPSPPRLRLTRADCAVLETNGLLDQQRVELIQGDLIQRTPKNWPHVHIVMILQHWLSQVFGFDFVLQEAPINVAPEDNPTSEPQPDLIVMNRRSELTIAKPNPDDLRLVVEVSDSTRLASIPR